MKKTITVDFDDTLAVTENGAWDSEVLMPLQRVLDYIKNEHKKGAEIHIVSFRYQSDKPEIERFCKTYQVPIKSITCTEAKNKIPYLKKIGSKLHIDDSVEVCTLCIMAKIDVLLVDWGQEKHNTTAKFMPKI